MHHAAYGRVRRHDLFFFSLPAPPEFQPTTRAKSLITIPYNPCSPFAEMISSTALAEEALQQAKLLDAYISAQGRPLTSFDEDTLTEMRAEMREARDALVDSSHVLKRLALGPAGVLTEIKWAVRFPPFLSIETSLLWVVELIALSRLV